jgi:hypothetical protein
MKTMYKKMRLDNYLCKHTVQEFLSLPEKEPEFDINDGHEAIDQLLLMAESLTLFHDQDDEPYAFIEDTHETAKIHSKKIFEMLSLKYYLRTHQVSPKNALNDALCLLSARANYDQNSPQIELFVRVAHQDNAFYYDLCDGNVVKITAEGWSVEEAPILFKRYSHQQRQVIPVSGGDPWRLFDFVNVPQEHQLLVLTAIISTFIPNIQHPILHPYGPHGSGKSSLCKIIKKLCDPSSVDVAGLPSDQKELVQLLSHHHVLFFDNLSDLPSSTSDILAMACTGAGFSKRKLYTDEDDIILHMKRCIGLNGINALITKPDLMDRAILLQLHHIESTALLEDKILWDNFDAAKPGILGGIFDVLQKAITIHKKVELEKKPRMVDFARWGCAIAEALDRDGKAFIASYFSNIRLQQDEIVQGSLLAQAVLKLMDDKLNWDGTMKQCHDALSELIGPDSKDVSWPRHSNQLRKALHLIEVNLMEYGIRFNVEAGHRREGVKIHFKKI